MLLPCQLPPLPSWFASRLPQSPHIPRRRSLTAPLIPAPGMLTQAWLPVLGGAGCICMGLHGGRIPVVAASGPVPGLCCWRWSLFISVCVRVV